MICRVNGGKGLRLKGTVAQFHSKNSFSEDIDDLSMIYTAWAILIQTVPYENSCAVCIDVRMDIPCLKTHWSLAAWPLIIAYSLTVARSSLSLEGASRILVESIFLIIISGSGSGSGSGSIFLMGISVSEDPSTEVEWDWQRDCKEIVFL